MAKAAAGIQVDLDVLRQKYEEIEALDAQIDSATGGNSAGKVALRNRFAKNVEADIEGLVNQIRTYLEGKSEEDRAGFLFGIQKALKDDTKSADEYVSQVAEANKSDEPAEKISPEELKALREQRSEAVKEYNAVRGILEMFKQDVSQVPVPETKRGGGGGAPKGKRAINRMTFFVDGDQVDDSKNSLSGVASIVGTTAAELKTVLKDAGVDLKNPSDFEVEVGAHKVRGERGEDDAAQAA